jgi:hypothetical protein
MNFCLASGDGGTAQADPARATHTATERTVLIDLLNIQSTSKMSFPATTSVTHINRISVKNVHL